MLQRRQESGSPIPSVCKFLKWFQFPAQRPTGSIVVRTTLVTAEKSSALVPYIPRGSSIQRNFDSAVACKLAQRRRETPSSLNSRAKGCL